MPLSGVCSQAVVPSAVPGETAAWSCPALVDGFSLGFHRLTRMQLFVSHRRPIADRRVAPVRVVPALNEPEHPRTGLVLFPLSPALLGVMLDD